MTNKPKCEIDDAGNKHWILNGVYHREDGPAIEYKNGDKLWWLHGLRHRINGPATESSDGVEWFVEGRQLYIDDAIIDFRLRTAYPELIASMAAYLVHSS